MEWLTIILSSLLTIITPVGLGLDTVISQQIRSQVVAVEQLAVRIDNVPSYQILDNKVDRIRIASRGIYPIEGLRIEALELESDPIELNIKLLQQEGANSLRKALLQPIQLGIRLKIKEEDINKALHNPENKAQLQTLLNQIIPGQDTFSTQFELVEAKLEFLENNRLRTQIQLQQSQLNNDDSDSLRVVLEAGFNIIQGRKLEIVEPSGSINERQLSRRLLNSFATEFNQNLDLAILEKQGLVIRVLQFSIDEENFNLATFIRLNPLQE